MFLDLLIPVGVVAALAWVLRAPDEPYFAGLAAAGVTAILVWIASLGLMLALGALELPDTPPRWVSVFVIGPILGEASRVAWGVRARASFVAARDWLFFGLGYGLFLFVGGVLAWGISLFSQQPDHLLLFYSAIYLCLSTFVGVLTAALLKANWPWWSVLAVAISANVTAVGIGERAGDDPLLAIITGVATAALSLVCLGLLLRLGHRLPPMTSATAHANTAQ